MLREELADDAEDVVLSHDQIGLAVHLDFSAAVFRDEHFVALLDGEGDELAVVITLAGAEGDDFALLRFFFGGIRNDDAALRRLWQP